MNELPEGVVLISDEQAILLGGILDRTLTADQAEAVSHLIYYTRQNTLKQAAEHVRATVKSEYQDMIAEGYNEGARAAADAIDPEVRREA